MIAISDSPEGQAELAALEARVNALLPPQYQFASGPANPRSMGSASLKYGPDKRIAWDEIWTTFCDLALAGGPPHRGSLLEAPTAEEVREEPAGYQVVCAEISRGIRMTTGLLTAPAAEPGWLEVHCRDADMASWLVRAVMAENVFIRQAGDALFVPAGPWYRPAKEVKNVIVSLAKTCHYWEGHLSVAQRQMAGALMRSTVEALLKPVARPEILPRAEEYQATAKEMARAALEATGLPAAPGTALGWVGVRFADEGTAAWFVRAAIAEDILARREEEVLYLPVPTPDQEKGRFEAIERLGKLTRIWKGLK